MFLHCSFKIMLKLSFSFSEIKAKQFEENKFNDEDQQKWKIIQVVTKREGISRSALERILK